MILQSAVFIFFFFVHLSFGLNLDGVLLLSFKFSILKDPLGVLSNWNSTDINPCLWNGITCEGSNESSLVTSLSLPNSQLIGSMPANLGMISNLRVLNLSNNSINGTIPLSIFMATELRTLDISGNSLSGELSEQVGKLYNLEFLSLSDNFLGGEIPENLTSLNNLTVISLKNNYFSGSVPRGVNWIKLLDLSMNLINGTLPSDFQGNHLGYFNVSFNRLSGEILLGFANQIPTNATIDLSFNNFSGEIPATSLFINQDPRSFFGNNQLCGKPLRNLCPITSSIYTPPNDAPPAIAAIPKTIDSSPANDPAKDSSAGKKGKSRAGTIIGIVVGDVLGIAFLAFIFLYVYRLKKKKKKGNVSSTKSGKSKETQQNMVKITHDWSSTTSSEESKGIRALACLRKQTKDDNDDDDDDSSSSASSTSDVGFKGSKNAAAAPPQQKGGELVTVDGDRELELEILLKASAYILGASGSSITYKAVLEDGTSLAVRRIGESGLERFKDFENQVRTIAKLIHPNLVRIRGFYWGSDEKLVIYDFIPNGSLANARHRKVGSSPCHLLQWEVRLKIAKGVARGLAYIHDKKHVHGNLKPSNILLDTDMEPRIGDFGLERLVTGETSYRPSGSSRIFGSKRSTASRESFQELSGGPTPSPSPSSMGGISPYYAPESLRSLKPHQKWDVYSFGVVLLELIMGKISSNAEELAMVLAGEESGGRVLRMADVAIRDDVEGKEDALLAIMRLGLNCISPVPQKRPAMKEVVHALEKFPSTSSSFCYTHQ
ncbi:probable LRR receptor-like serine/threonine-protein kinase At4g37250 [Impatiens glandulifera]|uniref:probable LRR receptor-like serine/threonine-protein kinase At4g37250 n=1 Tax=Impatiens glandulifera TaxID=253017 RepID=UPI001FB0EB4D|nr:probable LRR receptor-like serine/threonine-protein kinase At4g37250 [Impatiens glandulifera]